MEHEHNELVQYALSNVPGSQYVTKTSRPSDVLGVCASPTHIAHLLKLYDDTHDPAILADIIKCADATTIAYCNACSACSDAFGDASGDASSDASGDASGDVFGDPLCDLIAPLTPQTKANLLYISIFAHHKATRDKAKNIYLQN